MTTNVKGGTRTESVYDELRSDLLNGQLRPGQRLKVVALAQRFGVSSSVIREALTRLAEQDLVVASPQRGFSVRQISVDDLADLTTVRVQIESMALRQSFENGDVVWETTVLATHHTLERTPVNLAEGRFNDAWALAHTAFHQALLAGARSPRLEGIAASLRDCSELYRRWYWALVDDAKRDIPAEHRDLKDYALSRETDKAVDLLTSHIQRAPRALIAYAEENGLAMLPDEHESLTTLASSD